MSRIERILQAIIDGISYSEAPQSRIEEILLAIKNNTDYLKSPYSRVETLFLAIKDNTDYSNLLQSRIEEILEHKLHNIVYEKDALSRIEKLLVDWINKADYYELIGIPPLTFVSNGENLVDYRIYGASGGVGDITRNLFDAKNSTYRDGTFWLNAKNLIPYDNYYGSNVIDVTSGETITRSFTGTSANYFMREDGSVVNVPNTGSRENGVTIIVPDDCIIYVFNIPNSIDPNTIQVVVGSQLPETYEPYGCKIPIVCGGTTTNIYLNEPLGENESISMSDTGVSIPTINGTNILTVDTAVQPSNVEIIYAPKESELELMMKKN